MYPFPLVDPIHEPADISDTDFANLLALIDLQAQSPPPLQQQQPSFSVLASLGTTVPQSPAPSTVGPSQMFSDTALMALATPSPMSGTMGISPQLIYPDLLPPRHFTDPSPSATVANSLSHGSNTNDCIDMSVLHNCSPIPRTLRRTAKLRNNQCPCNHPYTPKGRKAGRGQKMVIPARNSDGTPMICCNCGETETPSWRRHPLTNGMLCNACGLYFRLHKKPRPIAFDENGKKQVIRKNAAVKREPINLGHAKEMASNLAVPFQALKLMPANRSLSLRNDEDEEEDELSAADSVDSVG
ncbi:hypothetical protein FBU59_001524 [Linderina macrospora]|uniref:Uncharacterized protein n=1 Tax=Linderina macrospora TaxID=4868 RepID=A0ACC1JDL3_9FUNG|nr:hypothetical protein FBU59_001524 [Linderina macrospora]